MAEPITLQSNEEILLKVRRHWIVLLKSVASIVVLTILPLLLFGMLGLVMRGGIELMFANASFTILLITVWFLLMWMALIVMWTDYYLDLWIITNMRVISIDQVTLFQRTITTLGIERIQEITVRTDNAIAALLHYGTIEIDTAGSNQAPVYMSSIPNPERVRALILEHANALATLAHTAETQQKLLRTVSHEAKNYLTKDAAVLAEIAEGDIDGAGAMVRNFAERALEETRKGASEMRSLLREEGAAPQAATTFDLSLTTDRALDRIRIAAEKKGLAVQRYSSGACFVNGSEARIESLVIKNLLENALNYTVGGTITVTTERDGEIVRLKVEDTGVGLSDETKERLFTEGGKGENSEVYNPASTGYGLVTVKEVVEAHGGTIRAESAGIGKGSQFIVEFPRA